MSGNCWLNDQNEFSLLGFEEDLGLPGEHLDDEMAVPGNTSGGGGGRGGGAPPQVSDSFLQYVLGDSNPRHLTDSQFFDLSEFQQPLDDFLSPPEVSKSLVPCEDPLFHDLWSRMSQSAAAAAAASRGGEGLMAASTSAAPDDGDDDLSEGLSTPGMEERFTSFDFLPPMEENRVALPQKKMRRPRPASAEEKKERRKESNRRAACKYRITQRQAAENVRQDYLKVHEENQVLRLEVESQRKIIEDLSRIIRAHCATCPSNWKPHL